MHEVAHFDVTLFFTQLSIIKNKPHIDEKSILDTGLIPIVQFFILEYHSRPLKTNC